MRSSVASPTHEVHAIEVVLLQELDRHGGEALEVVVGNLRPHRDVEPKGDELLDGPAAGARRALHAAVDGVEVGRVTLLLLRMSE